MTTSVKSSPLGLTVLALLHHRPLHPYGIQQLLKEWGKDQVVNVSQRAGLYRTIDRLLAGGLIAVRQTERAQQYPERTLYEVTDEGRAVAREWLEQMLSSPKAEFPVFPAALSNLLMLSPAEAVPVLERRASRLLAQRADLERQTDEAATELPRITLIEDEYRLALLDAEVRWLQAVLDDMRNGDLSWSPEALASAQEATEANRPTA